MPIPLDLSKLTDVLKNYVVKKTEYNKLFTKVDNIDTTNFVSRTKFGKDGLDFDNKVYKVDKKIQDVSDLVKKTDVNSKIIEVEGKIPSIIGLVKKTDFSSKVTEIEGKIPDVSSLITKTNFNTKITEIECKIPDVISLITKTNFNTKITDIEGKIPDISSLITKTDFNAKLKAITDRVTKNIFKHLLIENELKKLKKNDLSYFTGRNYFGDHNINYLVFEVSYKYLNLYNDSNKIVCSWSSKGVSKEIIKAPRSNNNILYPTAENFYIPEKTKLKFNGSCLVQSQIRYTPQTIVKIYIVYEITKNNSISNYLTLESCLFRSVKLTKNPAIDKCKYSGYGIGFDRRDQFSFGDGFGQNVIIFEADMSSSVHANNRTKIF